jgi:hypothetical protein
VPRKLTPLHWVNEPVLIAAMCAVSQSQKNFSVYKMVEVRDEYWRREEKDVTPLVSFVFVCIFFSIRIE